MPLVQSNYLVGTNCCILVFLNIDNLLHAAVYALDYENTSYSFQLTSLRSSETLNFTVPRVESVTWDYGWLCSKWRAVYSGKNEAVASGLNADVNVVCEGKVVKWGWVKWWGVEWFINVRRDWYTFLKQQYSCSVRTAKLLMFVVMAEVFLWLYYWLIQTLLVNTGCWFSLLFSLTINPEDSEYSR